MKRKAFSRESRVFLLAGLLGMSLISCGGFSIAQECTEQQPTVSPSANRPVNLVPSPILPSNTPLPVTPVVSEAAVVETSPTETPVSGAYSVAGVVVDGSNCRSGPGTEFGIRSTLQAGHPVRVVGVNAERTWWLVFPSDQAEACWLWAFLLEVADDTSQVQVVLSPPTPTPLPLSANGETFSPQEYEQKLFELVNQARIHRGYQPLALYPPLERTARRHSQDMAENDFFGHLSFTGEDFNQRLTAEGMVFSNGGETLYAGGDPYQAYHIWMNSEIHFNLLMNPAFTHIGIGVVYAEGRTYGKYVTVDLAIPVLPAE